MSYLIKYSVYVLPIRRQLTGSPGTVQPLLPGDSQPLPSCRLAGLQLVHVAEIRGHSKLFGKSAACAISDKRALQHARFHTTLPLALKLLTTYLINGLGLPPVQGMIWLMSFSVSFLIRQLVCFGRAPSIHFGFFSTLHQPLMKHKTSP